MELKIFKSDSILKAQKISHKKMLVSLFGEETAERVERHEIWLGMTKLMAEQSIGYPEKVNTDKYSFGIHEQWVYSGTYLYFENHILTSWSD
jgi:hypothetical protein